MDQRLRNYYLEARVNSASPGQLLVMLYDGLVEHAEAAETALAAPADRRDQPAAARAVTKCIDIITELSGSLRAEFDPELCGNLGGLYLFFTRELSEGLDRFDAGRVRAILPLLRDLRSTWAQALKISSQAQPIAA